MATIKQIRPLLCNMSPEERLSFINKYVIHRYSDMQKPNHYVREAAKKKERVAGNRTVKVKANPAQIYTIEQRNLLAKLGIKL